MESLESKQRTERLSKIGDAPDLSEISSPQGVFAYGYGPDNGLVASNAYPNGINVDYQYDILDRITRIEYTDSEGAPLRSFTYAYDAAGNVTRIHYKDETPARLLDIEWNERYQITAVYTNDSIAETYGYDALGRRVWISDGSTTNYLVYDGIHVVAEVNSSGELQKSYTWGPGVDNLLAMSVYTNSGGTTAVSSVFFYVKDHLGSVIAIVDETGTNVVERYEYDAWGNVTAYDADDSEIDESQIGNRYLWQGREYSWTTGLYNFRARWYDAEIGRWLSKDPIGISGGLNQYVFCGDDPVNGRDPEGLCKTERSPPWEGALWKTMSVRDKMNSAYEWRTRNRKGSSVSGRTSPGSTGRTRCGALKIKDNRQ